MQTRFPFSKIRNAPYQSTEPNKDISSDTNVEAKDQNEAMWPLRFGEMSRNLERRSLRTGLTLKISNRGPRSTQGRNAV